MSMPTSGQNGALTFSGTSGQRISLAGTNGLTGFICTRLRCQRQRILKPDDIRARGQHVHGRQRVHRRHDLPATGTYTIVVDPMSHAVGNVTLTLYDVPADYSSDHHGGGIRRHGVDADAGPERRRDLLRDVWPAHFARRARTA